MAKSQVKRGRGRPNKFADNPRLAAAVVKVVKQVGKLGEAQEALSTKGVTYQPRPGAKSVTEVVVISLPTLANVVRNGGLQLKRGRPAA